MSGKHCRKCNVTKPATEFYRDRANRDGLKSCCKLCSLRIKRDRYASNATDRERSNDRCRKYYEANRDKETARKREYAAVRRVGDPLWNRLVSGAVRARKLGCAVESFDSADLLAHWQASGIVADRCHYTGEPLGDDWHLDHMTPLSRGGSHSVGNLVPCSAAVNISKHNQTADEYLQREDTAV